ncbi:MAG: NAD(P)-dependent oxidoreductase [Pseudomonadota bacterium]
MQPDPAATPLILSQWGAPLDRLISASRPGLRLQAMATGLDQPLPEAAQVLLVRPFSPAQRALPPPLGWPFNLRWVQLISVGFDNYPPWLLRTPGLPVSTAHRSSSEVIADFALASILRVQLRLVERRVPDAAGWRLSEAPGLAGSVLGIVGFGGIGEALARKALALGMRVQALRRSDAPLGVHGVQRATSLAGLLQTSDHLVLAAPGTADTRHLINADTLAQAKPGLHLVNVARGTLVDAEALRLALDDGRVAWASLDVTDPEPLPAGHWLYSHPRVWLTPHTCAISPQVQQGLVDKLLRSLDLLAAGQPPESLIQLERGY